MIIDIHTHYGVIEGSYCLPIEMQLKAMEKYHIDYALISNIECGIYHKGIEGNIRMLDIVRNNKDKLGCMFWGSENLDDGQKVSFEKLYLENKDIVKGIKIHPDISGKQADDKCFDFFYKMSEEYELPVLFHTKDSPYSRIEYVVNVAKKYPNAVLILGHMGIGSDGLEALKAVQKYDNIYGDTAWVSLAVVEQGEKMGISHKIMFGTDSPISGNKCYMNDCYIDYYACKSEYMQAIMANNAKNIFNI